VSGYPLKFLCYVLQIYFYNNYILYVYNVFRDSGKRLLEAVLCGVKAFKSNVEDFGIITTPMLHFFVRCYNTNCLYGQPNEHSYYTKLTNSFKTLRKMASNLHT